MPHRFGTDGLRGVAGADLTPEVVLALGRASARLVHGSPFLVGRDTRRSGPMLAAAFAAGLSAEGVDVVDVGVLPTPALAWLSGERSAPGAMISASHNPFLDNGVKLISATGAKLAAELEAAVEVELAAILSPAFSHQAAGLPGVYGDGAALARPGPVGSGIGVVEIDEDALSSYVEHLCSSVPIEAVAGLEVVVDCANGAVSAVAPQVLGRLGIRHVLLSASPNGVNINADCGSTHLGPLKEAVVARGAALGVALDGDADRVLAVDHEGKVVDGDELMAIFALDLAGRGELADGTIAATVLSNLGLKQGLAAHGIAVVETPVGDRHIAEAVAGRGLSLGGEASGHILFGAHGPTGDGLLTALRLVEVVSRTGRSLAELASGAMTKLPQVMRSVAVPDPSRLQASHEIWEAVSAVELELAGRGRVLIRASGTEQVVRVMAEADTEEIANRAVETLVAVVGTALGATTGGAGAPSTTAATATNAAAASARTP